jgi:hypothetical protein
MYYYTDYNTFKLILKNGTLRFKESTSSNDRLRLINVAKCFLMKSLWGFVYGH